MGKEVLTGLIDENAKRGFEKARDRVTNNKGESLSMTGLLEEVGHHLALQAETLEHVYGPDTRQWPALKIFASITPRSDDPRSAKYRAMRGTVGGQEKFDEATGQWVNVDKEVAQANAEAEAVAA